MPTEDETNIPEKVEEWWHHDRNSRKGDPLNRILLPTRQPAMIHRAVVVSYEEVQIPPFAVSKYAITEITILDTYHGREIHLHVENQSSNELLLDQNTFCNTRIKILNPEESRWLTVLVLIRESTHYVCLAELDLENAKLVVHRVHVLKHNMKLEGIALTKIDRQRKHPNNKISVFILMGIGPGAVCKEIQLIFPADNSIPTITIQSGPFYEAWGLSCAKIINQKVYGFVRHDTTQVPPNLEELIVAEIETIPPHELVHREKLSLRGFDEEYKNKWSGVNCWHGTRFYVHFTKEIGFDILFMDLETLNWRRFGTYKHESISQIQRLFVCRNELMLYCAEKHENLPERTKVYNSLIFPLGKPFTLTKLALFATQHFSHKNPKYRHFLDVVRLSSPLRPLPNSTKYQHFQDEEFQSFLHS